MNHDQTFQARLATSVAEIGRDAWDRCASSDGAPYNPFVDFRFLDALERSGSVGGRSGWSPAHVVLEDVGGGLAGVSPAYVKRHSQGEYVFDHAFADAYQRAGGAYYPKLQVAAPFTPATGPRLLAAPGGGDEARAALASALLAVRNKLEVSSVHVTFCTREEQLLLVDRGYLARVDRQFHWTNAGYGTYDDFLADLASRKRKQLKRERREAAEGVTIRRLTGSDLVEAHWDAFFDFYVDTGERKWGRPYLNRRFFSMIGESMPERILLVIAEIAGRPIAGALNFIGGDALYGRYWGAVEERPFLHFELCYHQAIDAAIERGLARVEAGAQGEHKLARGYRPVTTYSAHAFADRGLHDAVGDYLVRERRSVAAGDQILDEATPFRRGGEDAS